MPTAAASRLSSVLPLGARVLLLHPQCDRISACASSAQALIRSLRQKDFTMELLNHENLLDPPLCYPTLALLTIYEATRLIVSDMDANVMKELVRLEALLLAPPYTTKLPSAEETTRMRILEHVHMGDGIAALVLERSTRPPKAQF